MIVDSHLHLFRNGYGHFATQPSPLEGLSDIEAYERLRETHDIGAGLVVSYEAEGIDPSNNAYVRDLAASRPWIHSVAYLSPSSAPSGEHIADLLAAGHSGIALYLPDEASVKSLDAWPSENWRVLSEANAIVSFNARPEAIRHLGQLIDQSDTCQFLFSHLGLPGRHETAPSLEQAADRLSPLLNLATYPNVAVKISGLYAVDPVAPHVTAQPFIELLLEHFGGANLHWGSDFSPALDYVSFAQTMDLVCLSAIEDSERALILGESLAAKLANVRRGRQRT
ncbi:MAG: amidohydrolase family protein [Mesorhizobium sp.]|nr:amidohydrolase family protein [Mesorhizobium sp.]MBL8580297.1 amidohydrolase family protein [Mesorhizobium sp.]